MNAIVVIRFHYIHSSIFTLANRSLSPTFPSIFTVFFLLFFPAAARPAVVARGYATEESEADFDARWIVSQRRHPPATVLVLLFIYARITRTHSHSSCLVFNHFHKMERDFFLKSNQNKHLSSSNYSTNASSRLLSNAVVHSNCDAHHLCVGRETVSSIF